MGVFRPGVFPFSCVLLRYFCMMNNGFLSVTWYWVPVVPSERLLPGTVGNFDPLGPACLLFFSHGCLIVVR